MLLTFSVSFISCVFVKTFGYLEVINLLSSCPAAVKDIDRFQEKITVSLHQASLPPSLERVKLGVVVREELPVHYRSVCGRPHRVKGERWRLIAQVNLF